MICNCISFSQSVLCAVGSDSQNSSVICLIFDQICLTLEKLPLENADKMANSADPYHSSLGAV